MNMTVGTFHLQKTKNISNNKMMKNSFDQDALESFLKEEKEGLKYYLRKYEPHAVSNNSSNINAERGGEVKEWERGEREGREKEG